MNAAALRLITFDLDDTLWPCAPVIRGAEQRLYAWMQVNSPLVPQRYTVEDLREQRLRLAQAQPALRHDLTELRRRSLRLALRQFGYPARLAEDALGVFLEARNEVTLYEDAIAVLDALRGRYVLGALTNGNADVRRTAASRYFDFAVSAAEVGAGKPDVALFRTALERAGVDASEALHVGDDPEHDVVGAQRAGITAVWLNRAGVPWPGAYRPAALELRDLRHLRVWLDS